MIVIAQQFERRFTNEYLREFYFDKHAQVRVWLGPSFPGKEANEYMVTGRWADVIVFEPNLITIIEAKLEPKGDAIGQLELYAQMFGQTLRFEQYWKRPIKKVLLTTRLDEHVKELAEKNHIEYVIYRPEWIKFWEKRRFRL